MMSNELLKRKILDSIYNNKDNNYVIEKVIKVFDIVGGSQPPKSQFSEDEKDGYVRLYQTRDYGEKPVPVYVEKNSVSKFTKKGDILLARYVGSLGKVFIAEEGAYNVALAKINVKDVFYREYIRNVLSSKPVYEYLHNSSMASTRSSLNENNISYINLVVPDNKIIEDFNIYAKNYIEINLKIIEENQRLKSLKEFILPLLMNGQINVDDIEI